MAWKTISTVIIVVVAIGLAQMFLIGPLFNVQNSLNETGDYSNQYFDGNSIMTGLPGTWLNMGLIGMFGVMTWGLFRIVRRERLGGRR